MSFDNALNLLVDVDLGHGKVMGVYELFDDGILSLTLGCGLPFPEEGLAHLGPQFVEILKIAQVLGELLVQLRQLFEPDLLEVNQEPDGLAGQPLCGVVLGVGDIRFARFARLRATESLGERLKGALTPDFDVDVVLFHRLAIEPGDGLESDQAMVAVLSRTRVDIDELGLGFTELLDTRADVVFRHLGFGVRHLDTAVIAQFKFRCDLEFGFEADLAGVLIFQVLDLGTADYLQVVPVIGLLEVFRDQLVERFLADFAHVMLPDNRSRRLARTKAFEVNLLADLRQRIRRFGLERGRGNRNFQPMPATFNECQCKSSTALRRARERATRKNGPWGPPSHSAEFRGCR